jgi:hypothetical protein
MIVERALIRKLDLSGALAKATQRPGDFFPSRVSLAAATRSTRFIPVLASRLASGYQPSATELVQVPKWSGATRPAADLAVGDRVLLDALIAFLRSTVEDGLVHWSPVGTARREAEHALLSDPDGYVLSTDVASFYEYVDHDILANELLDLTGEHAAVAAIADLLGTLYPRRVGLPQGPSSVGFLADVYLSIVDRKLIRSDYSVTRYTDDYRIPTATWWQAQIAQLKLETHLRDIGLIINIGKTTTPKVDGYAARERYAAPPWNAQLITVLTAAAERQLAGISLEADADADEYPGTSPLLPDELDPSATLRSAVESDFLAQMDASPFWGTPDNVSRSRRIKACLPLMARLGSTIALDHAPFLLARYPHLTMELANYMRAFAVGDNAALVVTFIARLVEDDATLFQWQNGWLLHALIPNETRLPPSLIAYVLDQVGKANSPWFVRGRAAIVLATENELPAGAEYARWMDIAPDAVKPDFVAALTINPDTSGTDARPSDPVSGVVREVVSTTGLEWL